MRYHINPETGAAGACRATARPCPYLAAGEHFGTAEEARAAYEAIMAGQQPPPLSWLLSKPGEPYARVGALQAVLAQQVAKREGVVGVDLPQEAAAAEEWKALNYYTMAGYEHLNQILRGEATTLFGDPIRPEQRAYAERLFPVLDRVLARAPEEPKVVYRYVSSLGKTAREAIERLRREGVYTEAGYMSTSATPEYPAFQVLETAVGQRTSPQERFLLEIATKKGVSLQQEEVMSPGDVQSQELEVLLPRGLRFEVAGVELRKPVEWSEHRDLMLSSRARYHWSKAFLRKLERESTPLPVVKLVEVT